MKFKNHFSWLVILTELNLSRGDLDRCRDTSNQIITTCSECIRQSGCIWCPDVLQGEKIAIGCIRNGSYTCEKPPFAPKQGDFANHIKQDPLGHQPPVQITPQVIAVEVNPSTTTEFNFNVSLSENPVDIYFVMDLSSTMKNHRSNLINAANSIAERISQITRDFRLGFGSFSDKPVVPFSGYSKRYFESPVPYAFRHELPLTNDANFFKRKVGEATLTSNVDSPESGLDALAQTVTCDVIGWRRGVRRVVIFVTEDDSHFAYDGLLGGIVFPNDGKCHLTSNNGKFDYTEELNQDYPSYSQIRELLSTNQRPVVIFAVPERMRNLYEDISQFIQDAKYVGGLTSDPSSIENIVIQHYNDIKGQIKVRSRYETPYFSVNFTADCGSLESGTTSLTCKNITEDDVVSFSVNLNVDEKFCLQQNSSKNFVGQIFFELDGFARDTLEVRVRCEECDCKDRKSNANECNGHGDLVCGGCECYEGFLGRTCECDIKETTSYSFDLCHPPNGTEICSNEGECRCGHCDCRDGFSGQYCQCHQSKCPSVNSKVCSGFGACLCNGNETVPHCLCEKGHTGHDCNCPTSQDFCKDAWTNNACSNRGKCECGKCRCDSGFEGKFCQRSTSNGVCAKLEPCIKHAQFKTNITMSVTKEWEEDCKLLSTIDGVQIFGQFIEFGCLSEGGDGEEDLIFFQEDFQFPNCPAVMAELEIQKSRSSDLEDHSKLRGDIISSEKSMVQHLLPKDLDRCAMTYQGCEVIFYHDGLESDEHFDKKSVRSVYIIQYQLDAKEDRWGPLVHCAQEVPLAVVLGSTIGFFFLICVAVFVTVLVLINIRDRQAWKRYLALREENEARLGQFNNPLYQERSTTTVANPAFGH